MSNRLNRRLKSAFAPAALGLTLLFSGCAILGNGSSDDKENKRPVNIEWEALNRAYGSPYQFDGEKDNGQKSRVKAVQIETSVIDIPGLLLQPYYSPRSVLGRHGEAAADIINTTADGITGKDIDVRFMERPLPLEEWFNDPDSHMARTLFKHADVVTLSMGYPARGDQRFAYSPGHVNTAEEISAADSLAAQSSSIFVLSAGNSGSDMRIDLERETAWPHLRFDTFAKVGEAGIDRKGVYVEAHSSRSAPSFVTMNPFFQGFEYPYFRDKELRGKLKKTYKTVPYGHQKKGAAVFAEQIKKLSTSSRPKALEKSLQRCHPDFKKASFKNKKYLKKSPEWQVENTDKVRKAFISCLEDAADFLRTALNADKDGNVSELSGTSFSAPYAGGLFSAMTEKYPELNEYDLMAAALIAAKPVDRVKRQSRSPFGYKISFDGLDYRDNGRDLPFNNREAGFGYLDAPSFDQVAAAMANRVRSGDATASAETKVSSGQVNFTQPEQVGNKNVYEIDIDEDMVSLRTMLMLRFSGPSFSIPDKITLINPAGGQIELSPTRNREYLGISLASTNGHFGNHAKGTWKIVLPRGSELHSARLDIAGMERGGLVDEYIATHGADLPSRDFRPITDQFHFNVTPSPATPKTPVPMPVPSLKK